MVSPELEGANPDSGQVAHAVVNRPADRAGRQLQPRQAAAAVVFGQRRVVVRVLRADVHGRRVSHAAEAENRAHPTNAYLVS